MTWKEFADTDCLQLELGRAKSRGFRGKMSNLIIAHSELSSRYVLYQHGPVIEYQSAVTTLHNDLYAVTHTWRPT